jgi:hypothetical protein
VETAQITRTEELITAIKEEWGRIEMREIQKYCTYMRERARQSSGLVEAIHHSEL